MVTNLTECSERRDSLNSRENLANHLATSITNCTTKNIVIILLSAGFLLAQTSTIDNIGLPMFHEEWGFFPSDSPPNADMEIYLSVPYERLQFVRDTNGYDASFSALIALFEDKELIAKTTRTTSINVARYAETNSPTLAKPKPYILKEIPPGSYVLRTIITDLETDAEYKKETEFTVTGFPLDGKPHFSSIVLLEDASGRPCFKGYCPVSDSLFFKLELLYPRMSNGTVIRGLRRNGKVLVADTLSIPREGGTIDISSSFSLPEHIWETTIFAEILSGGKIIEKVEKAVHIVPEEHFWTLSSPEETIEQISLIATDHEIRAMEDALEDSAGKLDSLIEEFWNSRDPTPMTETNEVKQTFYERLAAANKKFNEFKEGWRTDRGKVYIIYGEPDEIERHPFDPGYKAYEIWYYYYLRKTFYFVDYIGDGTYELVREE